MNTELLEALTILEEEKDISRDTLMDAIENSLINACKNHFGKADNIKVIMDKETCDYTLIQEKTVVEEVEDKVEQISLADAKMIDPSYEIGDIVQIPVESKSFGRIATQNAKNLILQAGICCYDYRKNKKHQIKLSGVPFHEFLPLARLITSGHFYHL